MADHEFRAAAITLWGAAGAAAHDLYAQVRRAYFPHLPAQVAITIGLSPYGACVGDSTSEWEHGPRIFLESRRFSKVGLNAVRDTVIHECVHLDLTRQGLNPHHEGQAWYDQVNALSPAVLGRPLDLVYVPASARYGAKRKSVREANPAYDPDDPKSARTLVRKVKRQMTAQEEAEQAERERMHVMAATWPGPFRPADFDRGLTIGCPSH